MLYWRGERDRAIEAIKERDARIAELAAEFNALHVADVTEITRLHRVVTDLNTRHLADGERIAALPAPLEIK